jgi:hypothetical protein
LPPGPSALKRLALTELDVGAAKLGVVRRCGSRLGAPWLGRLIVGPLERDSSWLGRLKFGRSKLCRPGSSRAERERLGAPGLGARTVRDLDSNRLGVRGMERLTDDPLADDPRVEECEFLEKALATSPARDDRSGDGLLTCFAAAEPAVKARTSPRTMQPPIGRRPKSNEPACRRIAIADIAFPPSCQR